MNAGWKEQLAALAQAAETNANSQAGHLAQIEALRHGSVIALQSGFRIIQVEGEDAQAFLQGQLSSDIREVTPSSAQYSSYSTAKGRMLANFLVWTYQQAYYLLVAKDLADAIIKRLSLFVLRAKVKLSAADQDWRVVGLAGGAAETWLSFTFSDVDKLAALSVLQTENEILISLPGKGYLLAARTSSSFLDSLQPSKEMTVLSQKAWSLRDIDAGIAWVCQATQERFVPQMANMELIGAVSFKKGCYPGQEIVARTQYLGKLKRRLFKVALTKEFPAGTKLFGHEVVGQPIGMLTVLCQVDSSRYEGLAVVQSQAWDTGIYADVELKIPVECLSLPYSFDDKADT